MVTSIQLENRKIGPDQPCFIIAEAGVNHNGSIDLAKKLVDVALAAGADAVKFQTFKTEQVIHSQAPKADYQIDPNINQESQFEMVKRLELSYDEFEKIFQYCQKQGIIFLSSPFDVESADFLDGLGVGAFKLGSGEIINTPFLIHIAQKGKPIFLSTGMSTLDEVREAVHAIQSTRNQELILLHCVSNYPAAQTDSNLLALKTLMNEFSVLVGWSDHTIGNLTSILAVALGATVLERHFTVDKNLPGPDHQASLSPDELSRWVNEVRQIGSILGSGIKVPVPSELEIANVARKSLHLRHSLKQDHVLSEDDLIALRPGTGILPNKLSEVCGRKLVTDLPAGTLLLGEHIE